MDARHRPRRHRHPGGRRAPHLRGRKEDPPRPRPRRPRQAHLGLEGRVRSRIIDQLKKLGGSCDWQRTRFTLDEVCSEAVRRTFFEMFKDGLIYRGKRLVNWDTHLQTAVADDEVYYERSRAVLDLKYPVAGPDEALTVSTTRPETMLGDTAVAVNPADPRYKQLVGRGSSCRYRPPHPHHRRRHLVDPKLGTGCVKVTPAHDPNDYEIGLRHDLAMINILNPDGTINDNAGPYAGLDRYEVRKRVVADLEARGLIDKIEPTPPASAIPTAPRPPSSPTSPTSGSSAWATSRWRRVAQRAMDAVNAGRVRITPDRYAKTYLDWLGEKRDWCICRQLWWGHRIPIWHCETCSKADLQRAFDDRRRRHLAPVESRRWLICAEADLSDALGPGHTLRQDPDVLDTWFSSALWPHSTLGWPEETPELPKYYPTSVLSTARDIITLWVARMVMIGQFNVGDVPFRDVYIHPVILDGDGKRMSKTAGNGIDPVDIIEAYGADALRFTLALFATETQDLRMPVEPVKNDQGLLAYRSGPNGSTEYLTPEQAKTKHKSLRINTSERFEQGRTFPNKFWNSARFALLNMEGYTPGQSTSLPPRSRTAGFSAVSTTPSPPSPPTSKPSASPMPPRPSATSPGTPSATGTSNSSRPASRTNPPAPSPSAFSPTVLDGLCRLLHPIMPFVTESVWEALGQVAPVRGLPEPSQAEESVCIADWPVRGDSSDPDAAETVRQWQEKIQAIRNLRAERNVPVTAKITPIIVADPTVADRLRSGESHIRTLTGAETLEIAGLRHPPQGRRRRRPPRRRDHPPPGGPHRQGRRTRPPHQATRRPRQAAQRRSLQAQ